ncbi:UDP-N-acetylmuramoyl-L-alanyl-D-glutamate-2, 6-diaminopimelate ligase isoform X2 [Wolffia australiana]
MKKQRETAEPDISNADRQGEAEDSSAMLPSNIIDHLVAREKQTFSSDTESETIVDEPVSRKKRQHKHFGAAEAVILKELQPSHCLEDSMEFLKKRKFQVPRSFAALKNSGQAFRSISAPGGLLFDK